MLSGCCSPVLAFYAGLHVFGRIMLACVILHNMIVEDEKEQAAIHIDLNENPGASFALPPEVNVGGNLYFADVMRRNILSGHGFNYAL